MTQERAVLAGGCFWGMQDLIRRHEGVISTRVGYSGGDVPNATYRNHGTHAKAIEIVFDPAKISYRRLLEFFFQIHDPTTRNRQGNDIGTSYRSAIFYTSEEQKRVAEDTIADVEASGLWPGKVVTEIAPAGDFWKPNPSTKTIWSATPPVTPVTSSARTGSSPHGPRSCGEPDDGASTCNAVSVPLAGEDEHGHKRAKGLPLLPFYHQRKSLPSASRRVTLSLISQPDTIAALILEAAGQK